MRTTAGMWEKFARESDSLMTLKKLSFVLGLYAFTWFCWGVKLFMIQVHCSNCYIFATVLYPYTTGCVQILF